MELGGTVRTLHMSLSSLFPFTLKKIPKIKTLQDRLKYFQIRRLQNLALRRIVWTLRMSLSSLCHLLQKSQKIKALQQGLKHVQTLKFIWLLPICVLLLCLRKVAWVSRQIVLQNFALRAVLRNLWLSVSLMKDEIYECPKLIECCQLVKIGICLDLVAYINRRAMCWWQSLEPPRTEEHFMPGHLTVWSLPSLCYRWVCVSWLRKVVFNFSLSFLIFFPRIVLISSSEFNIDTSAADEPVWFQIAYEIECWMLLIWTKRNLLKQSERNKEITSMNNKHWFTWIILAWIQKELMLANNLINIARLNWVTLISHIHFPFRVSLIPKFPFGELHILLSFSFWLCKCVYLLCVQVTTWVCSVKVCKAALFTSSLLFFKA